MPPKINSDHDKLYLPMFIFSVGVLAVDIYCFGYGFFSSMGWTVEFINEFIYKMIDGGMLDTAYGIKVLNLVVLTIMNIVRQGGKTKLSWTQIGVMMGFGAVLYLLPCTLIGSGLLYVLCCVLGYIVFMTGVAYAGRKRSGIEPLRDAKDTFEQCEELIETPLSLNLPIKYQWEGKKRHGYINIVAPTRASIVIGTPGSGKSFSIYNPIIDQMMAKGYTCFLYDYKFPDLSEEIYNAYLRNLDKMTEKMKGKTPRFCVINFDDARYSMRCNPLDPRYLKESADATEIADLIMRNVNPHSVEKEDFFTMSAKLFIDLDIDYLRTYRGGIYCTFPHLIELMGRNYKAVFEIFKKHPEFQGKLTPFYNALKGNAQEQLQGQIASAQIPLMRFASPSLYWVLSGNDFSLDVNNPEDPKIVCVGNNPDRQQIYGTTLALFASRMFQLINHKHKLPCGVLLDEFPTIFVNGIDNLIATARSNGVSIVLGAQDESQLKRDYGDKYAEVIFNTIGNIFSGQVNGTTAKNLSATFGREFRAQQSESVNSGGGDSVSTSYQLQEIMPQSRIETLSQGYFFGKVADSQERRWHRNKLTGQLVKSKDEDDKCLIDKKLFCGEVEIDFNARERYKKDWKKIPRMNDDFGDIRLEAQLRADPENSIKKELRRRFVEEEKRELFKNSKANIYDERSRETRRVADEQYEQLTDEEKARILDEFVERECRELVDKKLNEKFYEIKRQVDEIFESEGIPQDFGENDEEEDETDQQNTQQNRDGEAAGNGSNAAKPGAVVIDDTGKGGTQKKRKNFEDKTETNAVFDENGKVTPESAERARRAPRSQSSQSAKGAGSAPVPPRVENPSPVQQDREEENPEFLDNLDGDTATPSPSADAPKRGAAVPGPDDEAPFEADVSKYIDDDYDNFGIDPERYRKAFESEGRENSDI